MWRRVVEPPDVVGADTLTISGPMWNISWLRAAGDGVRSAALPGTWPKGAGLVPFANLEGS